VTIKKVEVTIKKPNYKIFFLSFACISHAVTERIFEVVPDKCNVVEVTAIDH
jgi:hypothetical protein